MLTDPPYVIVSNRGPVAGRGAGGLVAILTPAARNDNALWFSTSTDGTSERKTIDGLPVFEVGVEELTYRQYYDVFANSTLWYLHHGLWDGSRRPHFDRHWRTSWDAYQEVNRTVADAVARETPQNATVLIHDFQLLLVGKYLKEQRPDLKTVYFHHIPFVDVDAYRRLPSDVGETLLDALAANSACGFHVQRWADNFVRCCQQLLGRSPKTFIAPAMSDTEELLALSGSDACQQQRDQISKLVGDRKLILRSDRIEPAKNILRGFLAYDDLLERNPQWRSQVTFAAFMYPSRQGLADYLAYRTEIEILVERINKRWATDDWLPIVLRTDDDFMRAIAGLNKYDVLLVNSVSDGLNLVAKEGPVVNQNNGVVVLSREVGAWDELGDAAIGVNPFDIIETSDALLQALEMDDVERKQRAETLKQAASRQSPIEWVHAQLDAVKGS